MADGGRFQRLPRDRGHRGQHQVWEDAAAAAVKTASGSLRDLRVAEVTKLDVTVEAGKIASYRARLNLSFKYESGKS